MKSAIKFLKRVKKIILRRFRKPCPERFSEIDLIHQVVCKGGDSNQLMIDVGAQFGESFSLFQLFGWKVVAFEPDPNPLKQKALTQRIDRNVTLVRKAIADQPSENVQFYSSDESTGISSLSAFRESHKPVCNVEVSTLALELNRLEISKVDFLKIDAEGHDYFVLKGYPWDAPGVKPRIILCEFEDSKTLPLGYDWKEMAAFLSGHGYMLFVSEWYPIEAYGVRHRWRTVQRYPCELIDSNGWGNLIGFLNAQDATRFEAITNRFKT